MTTNDRRFLRHCDFTLSHCFRGTTCHKWSADYVTEYCGKKGMSMEKVVCTRFRKEVHDE